MKIKKVLAWTILIPLYPLLVVIAVVRGCEFLLFLIIDIILWAWKEAGWPK